MPKSLWITLIAIISIPTGIIFGFQHYYQPAPDLVFTSQGNSTIVWKRFTSSDNFTEYLSSENEVDNEMLTVNVFSLRNYERPQTDFYEHSKYVYESSIAHQTINCKNRTITPVNIFLYKKGYAKGEPIKEIYDLNDPVKIESGTVGDRKINTLCNFES